MDTSTSTSPTRREPSLAESIACEAPLAESPDLHVMLNEARTSKRAARERILRIMAHEHQVHVDPMPVQVPPTGYSRSRGHPAGDPLGAYLLGRLAEQELPTSRH